MPTLETPPNTTDHVTPEASTEFGRYGGMDHSDLVHLLSSMDDEVAKARFRESIYISLIICIALAWLALYGPRVLFHQGQLIAAHKEDNPNKLTYLETPPDLPRVKPPKVPRMMADQNHQAQTPKPVDQAPVPKVGRPAPPTPQPQRPQPQQPPTQQPQPRQPRPQQPQQQPLPQSPKPQPATNIPDSPRPQQPVNRPTFQQPPSNPGDSVAQAARDAANRRGQGGDNGNSPTRGRNGAKAQVEILSDTLGVDFGPYIRRLIRSTENAWGPLIPEECREPLFKTGTTLIRFVIGQNGVVQHMYLDDSSHDSAINKSAWGSITSQGQLEPLPKTFRGPNLELRFQFVVGPLGNSAQ